MQPYFNRKWEHTNRLICRQYQDDFCNLQFHAQIEIYFVDEGEMEFSVGGHHAFLQEKQLSIALSYVPHAYKTPEHSCSSALFIPPHLCEKFLSLIEQKRPVCPFITDQAVYDRIRPFYAALTESEDQSLLQQGYLYVILGILYENLSFERISHSVHTDLATQILTYIEEHHREELTPSALATHLGYSHSYLARLFRAHLGVTLGQYITAVKLKHALSMIMEEKVNVTECALESGFSSVSSFYRAFSKEFNCSPSEYIKRIHKK